MVANYAVTSVLGALTPPSFVLHPRSRRTEEKEKEGNWRGDNPSRLQRPDGINAGQAIHHPEQISLEEEPRKSYGRLVAVYY